MPSSRLAATCLLHNPHCSKSRGALELLRERGMEPHIVAYMDTPLTREELCELLRLLALPARALLRTGETEFAAMGLDDQSLDESALIAAMALHPRLIERPVLVHQGRAVIGRPPEKVLDLIGPDAA